MNTTTQSSGPYELGYTLIEVLTVISIISIVSAIAVPQLSRPSDRSQLERNARDIANALRMTRAASITRNTPMVLSIDVENRTIQSLALRTRHLSQPLKIEMTIAEPERSGPNTGDFRFFPDGSSTGGSLRLALNDHRKSVCVHWLTGQPRVAEAC